MGIESNREGPRGAGLGVSGPIAGTRCIAVPGVSIDEPE